MSPITAGRALRITYADIANCAAWLDVDQAALRAVMSVESRVSGYDAKRRPIILFEPHKFYAELDGEQRMEACRQGLAYPSWGEKPYPRTSDGNYERLEAARAIDNEKAFRAVSIGLGQVMGGNFHAAGHSSAAEMFDAARNSEREQLMQMANFIKARLLAMPLREHAWARFAEGYNGPGYRANHYDQKLATEFAHWERELAQSKLGGPERATTSIADLREQGSRTIAGADHVEAGVVGGFGALASAGAVASQIQDTASQVQSTAYAVQSGAGALIWAQAHWQIAAVIVSLGVAAYFAWRAWQGAKLVKSARVDDAQTLVNGPSAVLE